MSATLAATAFLMGLAGGPHCAAMCGAPCAGAMRVAGATGVRGMARFQLGRLAGYATAGGVAAAAVQGLGWLAEHAAALRPVWTFFHLAVLAWGLMLVSLARQPAFIESAGRTVWARVRPLAAARGGLWATGALWAFMPCGLLYSALLTASLAGGVLQGAAAMALFALGSGLSLGLAPAVLRAVQRFGNRLRNEWGTRLAGVLLVGAALFALWKDVFHPLAAWCGIA